MKPNLILLLAISLLSCFAHAEYKDGWNGQNFYEAMNLCRSAIVFPAGKDFETAALKKGQTRLQIRNEVISTTPAFDFVASESCYCAMNQYAKDYTYSSAKVRKMDFSEYIQTPACKEKLVKAMETIKANPKAHQLQ